MSDKPAREVKETETVGAPAEAKPDIKAEEQLKEMVEKVEKKETVVVEKLTKEEKIKRDRAQRDADMAKEKLDGWIPKTELGREVRAGKIKNIDDILEAGRKILEPEVVDLVLNVKSELLDIGQAKGKFGGGKRRPWKQTQKKTKEGNIVAFSVLAVSGDSKNYVGIGAGKAKETLPAKDKAIRKSKLNIMKILRGCGSYDCSCDEPHSIPFTVEGRCSSVKVKLMPAPQGTGLVACDELKKILKLAGIKDIYTRTTGKVRTTINLAKACMAALGKLGELK